MSLCDHKNCSMPSFPVLHYLPGLLKLMSIEPLMPSNQLILCHPFSFCFQSFPVSESFPKSCLLALCGQSIGASASVLPMSIQDWFSLGLTGLILLSKGLSRLFSSTTILQCSAFFMAEPSLKLRWIQNRKKAVTWLLVFELIRNIAFYHRKLEFIRKSTRGKKYFNRKNLIYRILKIICNIFYSLKDDQICILWRRKE